jgi:hypothetical protein
MTTELAYLRLKPWKLQWPRYAVMLRPIQIDRDGTYPGIVELPSVLFTWAKEYGENEGMLFIVMRADLPPSASAPVIFRRLTRQMLTECGCEHCRQKLHKLDHTTVLPPPKWASRDSQKLLLKMSRRCLSGLTKRRALLQ